MSSPRDEFARIARLPDAEIDLAEAALWIAAEEYRELDVPAYLARLDTWAESLRPEWPADAPLVLRAERLLRFLVQERKLRGNADAYYDPRNSYLNEVLDRGLGIPITLCIVHIAFGRRLGLDVHGICFPGHFLAKYRSGAQEVVIDAFAGVLLSRADCQKRLDKLTGGATPLDPAVHLAAATHAEILVRVLTNLKQIFLARGDLEGALSCSDRILLLVPGALQEQRDRDALRKRVRIH